MARNGTDQIVKKNSKLETFLKRNFDVDTYEKVRAYDSCIVCSEKEDKAFKYIILTDEWLYLTENPPKKVYETVHLKDLVSIKLINDFPSFLQGEEQQNTQHLVIKYLSNDPVKGKKPKSARKAKSDTADLTPRVTTPRSARTNPTNPIIRPYFRHSLSARETKEMKLQTARDILADLRSDAGIKQSEFEQSEKRVQFGESSGIPLDDTTQPRSISPILKQKSSIKSEVQNNNSSKKKGKKKKHVDPDCVSSNGTGSKLTPRIKGELRLDLTQLQTSDEEDIEDENSNEVTKNGEVQSVEVVSKSTRSLCGGGKKHSEPEETEEDFIITLRDGSTIIMEYLIPDTTVEETLKLTSEGDAVREVSIHLYIMNGRSKILMLIQSAKHNYLIRSTLEQDPNFVVKTTVITPRTVQSTSDKLEYLFRQLKTELQYSTNTMVDNFFHIHELKVATERNFALRKLFWKTPDVFRFMVKQIKLYVPMITHRMKGETEDDFRMARADELEYLVLLLETFTILFRETEIVPTRLHMMKSEAGHVTCDLITSLITCPEVPNLTATVSDELRILHNTSEVVLPGITQHEGELHQLLREYKNMATAVIFELLMIGEQAIWCDSETTLLNVSWIVKQLGDVEVVKPFVEHIIAEAMGIISSRCLKPVTPSDAVLLYHQFHILRTLTYFSKDITSFIRTNYLEEFKYYIQPKVLQVKLPTSYLLQPNIMRLMEWVVSEVLQQPVDLSPAAI